MSDVPAHKGDIAVEYPFRSHGADLVETSSDRTINSARAGLGRSWLNRWRRDSGSRIVLIFLLVGLIVAAAEVSRLPLVSSLLESMEFKVQDQFFAWRAEFCPQKSFQNDAFEKIVIVKLDNESLRRLGKSKRSDFTARSYANLVSILNQAGAHVIGLDVASIASRSDATTTSVADQSNLDDAVVRSQETHNLVTTPPATLESIGNESLESIGYSLVAPDDDGVVRHAQLSMPSDKNNQTSDFRKSFGLRIVEKYFGANSAPNERGGIFLKEHYFPQRFRLNFAGAPGSFPMVSLWRAFEWRKHYEHDGLFVNRITKFSAKTDSPFKNKIVLIGSVVEDPSITAGDTADADRFYVTPLSGDAALMSNVELQANIISNVLDRQYFLEPLGWEYLVIVALVSIVAGRILAWSRKRPGWYLAILGGMTIIWMAASFYAFAFLHLLIPSVVSMLAVVIPSSLIVLFDQRYLVRNERSRRLRLFRALAAKPLAQEIERSLLAELGLEGKHLSVTVVACQLHDFSKDNSARPAEETLSELNACLKSIMQCIGENNGLVERVWNCGVIGIWGAPIAKTSESQVELALKFVNDVQLRLQAKVNEFGDADRGSKLFGFSCGMTTGTAICGTINATAGDSIVMQYGAFGPAVDIAIELESLNAVYGSQCLLGADMATLIKDQVHVRELELKSLGGDQKKQGVFEYLSSNGGLSAVYDEAMALFKEAQKTYEAGRVTEAKKLFGAVAELVPNDRPTAIMLQRCTEQIDFTPKAD